VVFSSAAVSTPPHKLSVEEGIVITRVPPDIVQDVDYARASLRAAIAACGGVRRPLLVDARGARPLAPEVRHVYTGELLVSSFSAFAMLIATHAVARMMGNIYLRVARMAIPARLFTDEEAARAWLRGFVP
jgi:hypothetical protein